MTGDKQHITLQLDAHTVSMAVQRDQEIYYRQAGVLLNKRFQHYLQAMPKASAEELWMYVALEVAVNLSNDAREKSLQPVDKKVKELNELILKTINKE